MGECNKGIEVGRKEKFRARVPGIAWEIVGRDSRNAHPRHIGLVPVNE